ncbi:hypothetical protein HOLleu_15124 [Holothuria leucospilota]|uniref:Sushi domain-containing protein n=1 Tax=Holothuria leucospilota TaxID=206669 RepID=A0A9Q1H9E4_HOLLE|nr:hypothetical protein HOLleu_15124 [Holothuria leucospilota]
MDFPVDMMLSGLSLRAILIFCVLQVISSQSTTVTLTNVSPTEPVSETQTFQNVCLQEPPTCPIPTGVGHGSFQLMFSSDCEPYLSLTCDPGYTGIVDIVYCIGNNWEPHIEEGDILCAANCGKPPNIAFADVFILPESSDTIDAVNDSITATYEHETESIYQCLHYDTSSSISNLQRSRCINGQWKPFPSLECAGNQNQCQGEIAGLVALGVLVGVETILLTAIFIFCFRRKCCSNKDDTSMAVPNKKHSGNTYSGQRHSTPQSSMEDTPVYPPPRPPARTDTAVVGSDESSYYTYADVPVENGNDANTRNINGDDTSSPGVQRNKSIPQYLEIIS